MATNSTQAKEKPQTQSTIFTVILIGIDIAGFLDETIFHQLLQWHNFYWSTNEYGRILSDGLFHLFSTLVLLWGLFRVWRGSSQWQKESGQIILAGILMGAGGFNLFDGIVQHAILHFHLVNEYVCNTPHANNTLADCPQDIPYELVWDFLSFIVFAIGFLLWRQKRKIMR